MTAYTHCLLSNHNKKFLNKCKYKGARTNCYDLKRYVKKNVTKIEWFQVEGQGNFYRSDFAEYTFNEVSISNT